MSLNKILDKSEEGYQSLTWFAYISFIIVGIMGCVPPLAAIAFVVEVIIFVFIFLKRVDVIGTIYSSHLSNFIFVNIIGWVLGIILILLTATGVGAIIGLPAILILALWSLYRIIKGMLKLKDGKEFS